MPSDDDPRVEARPAWTRRRVLAAAGSLAGLGALAFGLRHRLLHRVAALTQLEAFTAAPAAPTHDPELDRTTLAVSRELSPAENVDRVLAKLGGIEAFVGPRDVVIIKVSAQWWNQGMTNVAAVRRVIEQVLERPGFDGEVIVFENTHFRMPDGSGLSRAWVAPSVRNVDVAGWDKLGDLLPYFAGRERAPVSFVGLVDAGPSALSGDAWHDPERRYGIYGGDESGPIAPGDPRDGYHWDFERGFHLARSWVDDAKSILTWPRFTSPATGLVVDLRDGVLRREGGKLERTDRELRWINLTTANEHGATGFTGACKSTMGVVDMSAGALGTHPLARGWASVHYFGRGNPSASWRMAGPLAHFAREVRAPDLILSVAEWVAFAPEGWDDEREDRRHAAATCAQKRTIVGGRDPVAIDAWLVRNLMADVPSAGSRSMLDLENPDAMVTKFLRYYREIHGRGTLDPSLVQVV